LLLAQGEEVSCLTSVGESKDFSMTSLRVRKVPAEVIGDSPHPHSNKISELLLWYFVVGVK